MATKTYVVTGTSSGIGLEIVRQLAARGNKVYATCRKKESSATGRDDISAVEGDVTVIEGIDVAADACGPVLKAALEDVTIDVLVHNAGSINGTRDIKGMTVMGEQALETVTSKRMLAAFQLNTLGPLRVTQALLAQIASPGGKIVIVSSGMGSIGDNGSGGLYAYRASKTAVNMIAKNMSVDLKDKGIAVVAVNPNAVITEFGPGPEQMAKWGGLTVAHSCEQLVGVMDALSMETTGKFMTVPKEGPFVEFPGGW